MKARLMSDIPLATRLKPIDYLLPWWYGLLQNPLWYVLGVAGLAGLTIYFHVWWWLTAGVALVWGMGLVWRIFSQAETEVAGEEQLQAWLEQALCYQAQINQALKSNCNKNSPLYGPSLAVQVNAWTQLIQNLIQRLAHLRRDELINEELVAVPKAITTLETQLAITTDAPLRSHLEQALARRRHQLVLLKGLQSRMKQAEIQIENTLSLLSTIYFQTLTGQSIRYLADYKNFITNLDEEVCQLQDQLEALHELKEEEGQSIPVRSLTLAKEPE